MRMTIQFGISCTQQELHTNCLPFCLKNGIPLLIKLLRMDLYLIVIISKSLRNHFFGWLSNMIFAILCIFYLFELEQTLLEKLTQATSMRW